MTGISCKQFVVNSIQTEGEPEPVADIFLNYIIPVLIPIFNMREIVHLQAGQCGNQIGCKVRKYVRNFILIVIVLSLKAGDTRCLLLTSRKAIS